MLKFLASVRLYLNTSWQSIRQKWRGWNYVAALLAPVRVLSPKKRVKRLQQVRRPLRLRLELEGTRWLERQAWTPTPEPMEVDSSEPMEVEYNM